MDSYFSSLTSVVFDSQSVVDPADAIGRFLPNQLHALANRAGRLIHRCHVADPAFDADDAVQDALLDFWRATRDGKFASIDTAEGMVKLLVHKLKQGVLKERAREETHKRGGASVRRVDAELEAIDSRAMSSEERALAEEAVEAWLVRLYRRDPLLRAIATKKAEGFSHREIGADLGLPVRAVEYAITLIKAILARRDSETD
jgi:DNA-directed RNA polymerase specialized sigma24 family protein